MYTDYSDLDENSMFKSQIQKLFENWQDNSQKMKYLIQNQLICRHGVEKEDGPIRYKSLFNTIML